MMKVALDLLERGHDVMSTWVDGHHETRANINSNGTPEERRAWAMEDVADILRSDTTILFTESGHVGRSGGRMVEFGMALAWGHRTIVVGPRENVFHFLDDVECYPDWPTCLEALR